MTVSEKIVAMENLQGQWVRYYNANQMTQMGTLFAEEESIEMVVDKETIIGKKTECLESFLTAWQQERSRRTFGTDMIFLNTPAFSCEGELRALWDAYIFRPTGLQNMSYIVGHFDAVFVEEKGKLKYKSLRFQELLELEPWDCKEQIGWNAQSNTAEELFAMEDPTPEEFIWIQKTQAKFSHFHRGRLENLFHEDAMYRCIEGQEQIHIQGLQGIQQHFNEIEKQEQNQVAFHQVSLISAPVIKKENQNHMLANWMVMQFSVNSADQVVLQLGQYHHRYVNRDGQWKIETFYFEERAHVVPFSYERGADKRYDRMSKEKKRWLYGPDSMGGCDPEAVFAIESIIPHWTYRLRSGRQMESLSTFYSSKQRDIYKGLHGFSLQTDYDEQVIRDYVARRLDQSFERSMPSFHTVTTPLVEVNDDGTYAKAAWLDFSISDLKKGRLNEADLRPYAAYVGKYVMEFAKEDGIWTMFGISWDPLIALPDFYYDAKKQKGWMKLWYPQNRFPEPFDYYLYEEGEKQ